MGMIDAQEAGQRLSSLSGWAVENRSLVRRFSFAAFPDAVAFVVRLGCAAEAAHHHPDIHLSYKTVTLTYTTHSVGGLTVDDFEGAELAGKLAKELGGA